MTRWNEVFRHSNFCLCQAAGGFATFAALCSNEEKCFWSAAAPWASPMWTGNDGWWMRRVNRSHRADCFCGLRVKTTTWSSGNPLQLTKSCSPALRGSRSCGSLVHWMRGEAEITAPFITELWQRKDHFEVRRGVVKTNAFLQISGCWISLPHEGKWNNL